MSRPYGLASAIGFALEATVDLPTGLDVDEAVIETWRRCQVVEEVGRTALEVVGRCSETARVRLAVVGLAAAVAFYAGALEHSDLPGNLAWPLRLGDFTADPAGSGFSRPRWLVDAAGRRVGIVDSDAGPALVGPLDRLDAAALVEADRLRWLGGAR
jgi:hypothetical protein